MHSVVIMRLATEAESTSAVLTTLVGSTMPSFFMSTYLPVVELNPMFSLVYSSSLAE
jgi:hypothetical protein